MSGGALALGALLLCTASLRGAQSAPASSSSPAPTADEIVARYIKARGGLKKIRSIETLRESGRVTVGVNRSAIVTRSLKRPGSARIEYTTQGVTGVFVSDGQHGWKMSPIDGDLGPTPLPDGVVKEAAEQADIEGPLVDYQAKGHTVALAGREMVGDREAYKLKLTLKSGITRYEYIDVKTFYRLRTETTRTIKGHPVLVDVTFGDYRKTSGTVFPHTIEIAAAGRPEHLNVVVNTVEVNPSLSDTLFAMQAPAHH